jgi:hypothetical protein
MIRLPLIDRNVQLEMITAEIPPARLDAAASTDDIAEAIERLFGPTAGPPRAQLQLPPSPRLRDVYVALIDTDQFRAACGRISASYAW